MTWSTACVGLLAATTASAGCAPPPPPTEGADVVTSSTAPALKRLVNRPADRTLRRGEVVTRVGAARPFSWRVGGADGERNGKAFPAQRVGAEGTFFVFESDVARNVAVPPVSWLCEKIGDPTLHGMPCRNTLFRLRITPRRFAAYIPCIQNQCPFVVIGEESRHLSYIQGLRDVQLVDVVGKTIALATRRWSQGAAWTGTEVVVLEVAPAFRRLAEITTEETDARSESVRALRGRLEAHGTGLSFEGEKTRFDRATGQRREVDRFRVSWGITRDGRLVPSR